MDGHPAGAGAGTWAEAPGVAQRKASGAVVVIGRRDRRRPSRIQIAYNKIRDLMVLQNRSKGC